MIILSCGKVVELKGFGVVIILSCGKVGLYKSGYLNLLLESVIIRYIVDM